MRKLSVFLALLILGLGPAAVGAPADASQPPRTPKVIINLPGVPLDSVVQTLSILTGKPVLLPDGFPGDAPVDVISGTGVGVPPEKAMSVLVAVLRKAGYTLVERESHIEIALAGKADGLPVHVDLAKAGLAGEAVLITVVEVKNADATKLGQVLQSLKSASGVITVYEELNKLVITDFGVNVRSMLALIEKLDRKGAESVCDFFEVQNSSTETLAPLAKSFVKNLKDNAGPLVQKRLEHFSVESNAATNSFILFGHPDDIESVKQHIRKFDVRPEEAARKFHTYDVLYRDADELKGVLDSILSAAKTGGQKETAGAVPQVIADKSNSALIVIAAADRYEEMIPLIKDLDRPRAQVEIEAVLMEISTDKLIDIGIELNSIDRPGEGPRGFGGSAFGLSAITEDGKVPIPPIEGGLMAGVFKDSVFKIAALIRASEKEEGISLVKAPRITTLDNVTATITISEEREYLKSTISPEGATREVTRGGFSKAATMLEITPHVNREGTVRLNIVTMIDQFLPGTATADGISLTNIAKREAKTEVCVPDGDMVVIAGLTRTDKSKTTYKVPILGHIPLLGRLFRREVETEEQRHLCIFITPHVHWDPNTMVAEAKRRKEEMASVAEKNASILPRGTPKKMTEEK